LRCGGPPSRAIAVRHVASRRLGGRPRPPPAAADADPYPRRSRPPRDARRDRVRLRVERDASRRDGGDRPNIRAVVEIARRRRRRVRVRLERAQDARRIQRHGHAHRAVSDHPVHVRDRRIRHEHRRAADDVLPARVFPELSQVRAGARAAVRAPRRVARDHPEQSREDGGHSHGLDDDEADRRRGDVREDRPARLRGSPRARGEGEHVHHLQRHHERRGAVRMEVAPERGAAGHRAGGHGGCAGVLRGAHAGLDREHLRGARASSRTRASSRCRFVFFSREARPVVPTRRGGPRGDRLTSRTPTSTPSVLDDRVRNRF